MKSFAIPYHGKNKHPSDQSRLSPSSPAFTLPYPPNPTVVAKIAANAPSTFSHRATAFLKSPLRFHSGASVKSSYSAGAASHDSATTSNTGSTDSHHIIHPYAAMVSAPLPVVSTQDGFEDEEECPVCLEPLSFSFRLPGEKPHIVPDCGHALHEVRSY
jgi:hypothetical protein